MPMLLQGRAVPVLAVISALATLVYLSLFTELYTLGGNDSVRAPHGTDNNHKYMQPFPQHQQQLQRTKTHLLVTTATSAHQVQPTPSITPSDHNFKVAQLHTNAFVSFCNTPTTTNPPPVPVPALSSSPSEPHLPGFLSYTEWINFVNKKNSKSTKGDTQQFTEDSIERHEFYERPPSQWTVNLTALDAPCDRLIHTSAHCLEALSKEHQYLVPPIAASIENSISSAPEMKGEARVKSSKQEKDKTMDFHVFWRGPITDKLSLNAHAFLFTQPLERARLHLWIDSTDLPGGVPENYLLNEFAAPLVQEPLSRYITFHAWDQAAELAYSYGGTATDGSLESSSGSDNNANNNDKDQQGPVPSFDDVKPVALSDEARFLILNRNGGVYLDADVVLLRDMSPFYDSGIEFAYEWSNTRMYNTAILKLFPGSSVARRILDGAKAREAEIMEKRRMEALLRQQEQLDREEADFDDEEDGPEAASDKNGDKKVFARPLKPSPQTKKPKTPSRSNKTSHHSNTTASRRKVQALSKRGEMRPNEIYHPARLRKYLRPEDEKIEGNGLIMMPPAFFDPLWLRVDSKEAKNTGDTEKMVEDLLTFPDAFSAQANAVCPAAAPPNLGAGTIDNDDTLPSNNTNGYRNQDFTAGPEVFFTGAYAYHWHNNWLTPIEPQSWMGLMRQAYDDFIAGRRPNLYGEWFM